MKNYFTISMFLLFFGCAEEETVASDTCVPSSTCIEDLGYYNECCSVSEDDQQGVEFELCTGTEAFIASHNYTNLSDLRGKVILLEFSASW